MGLRLIRLRASLPTMSSKNPKCIKCDVGTVRLGQLPVRMGGTSGGWHLVFGELADVGESTVPLDAFRCPKCHRLEFYDLDESIPRNDDE